MYKKTVLETNLCCLIFEIGQADNGYTTSRADRE